MIGLMKDVATAPSRTPERRQGAARRARFVDGRSWRSAGVARCDVTPRHAVREHHELCHGYRHARGVARPRPHHGAFVGLGTSGRTDGRVAAPTSRPLLRSPRRPRRERVPPTSWP